MKRMGIAAVLAMLASVALATLPGTSTRNDFTGNGSTTAFTFTFKTSSASWVEVFLGGVKQSAGYAISLNANQDSSPGGSVTFTPAPAAGTLVRIQRTAPLTQDTTWPTAGPFRAKVLEGQLDRLAMADQQLSRRIDDVSVLAGAANTAQALAADPADCAGSEFAVGIAANGTALCSQPAFSQLSGTAASGQLPAPTASSGGAVKAITCSGTDKLSGIDTAGSPVCTPDYANAYTGSTSISGTLTVGGFILNGTIGADLDMSGHRMVNLPTPLAAGEPVPNGVYTAAPSLTTLTPGVGLTSLSGEETFRAWKGHDGVVHLMGGVYRTAAGVTFTTLPVGYRPKADRNLLGYDVTAGAFCKVLVRTNGQVNSTACAPNTGNSATLDTVQFLAEQ